MPVSQNKITEVIASALAAHVSAAGVVVAYSGGIDSHVLLHAAKVANLELPVRAIHIDHQLQTQSGDWQRHCQITCEQLGVGFSAIAVHAEHSVGESPEAAAREARYRALVGALAADEILLTAHHLDDQAETVLLQLLRGSGVAGLAAMPRCKRVGSGWHVRPLIDVTKQDLAFYAQVHKLQFVDDPSNQSDRYQRNYVRNTVLPSITKQWPSAAKTIARSAAHCAESAELNAALASIDSRDVVDDHHVIDLIGFNKLELLRQKNLLRHWLQVYTGKFPSQRILRELIHSVIDAGSDSSPELMFESFTIRRYRDHLYVMPIRETLPVDWSVKWTDINKPLYLESLNITLPTTLLPPGLSKTNSVCVRLREGGEKIKLAGRPRKSLKALLQENGVPPWRRNQLPLIYVDDKLVAIFGMDKK